MTPSFFLPLFRESFLFLDLSYSLLGSQLPDITFMPVHRSLVSGHSLFPPLSFDLASCEPDAYLQGSPSPFFRALLFDQSPLLWTFVGIALICKRAKPRRPLGPILFRHFASDLAASQIFIQSSAIFIFLLEKFWAVFPRPFNFRFSATTYS